MKTFRFLYSIALVSAFSLSACGDSSSNSSNQDGREQLASVYACPMECEGDKTYSEEGACPVCGMDLTVKK